ncbi:MAG: hypothetical protein E7586_03855 [Ruminococcaceae bacterium]|nr:hypothetical protein [Oscillospiraceae bacterium]
MKKIPIWKNVTLLVSTFAIIMVAAFAWFYTGPYAHMNGLATPVGKASYIQISDNGDDWAGGLELDVGFNRTFKEISGDGVSFFAPVYEDVENAGGGFSKELVSFNKVNGNQYYYEKTLDLRTDVAQDVYLSPESSVMSVNPRDNTYIDGAIRVALLELDENGNETLKCIWAPNSTVEYTAATNSFARDGGVEPYYYYQKSTTPVNVDGLDETNPDVAIISTEGTDENGCGYNQEYKFLWTNGQNMPENAPVILTMDNKGEDNLYYKSIKVRVWLEGYDRECVGLLSGQGFTMKLQFTAQEVE